MKPPQRTIQQAVERSGVGVNLGREVTVRLVPAPPDAGLSFVRTDLDGSPAIPVAFDHVAARPRRTVLARGEAEVEMTEHLLATIAGLGIDNLAIELDGPELPIGDGSALFFTEMIQEAGIAQQDRPRHTFALREAITVADGGASIEALPADEGLTLSYTLEYPGGALPRQEAELRITPQSFAAQLAPARTFVLEREVAALIARGFGRGASLENTLVARPDGSVIANQLRFPDELARHKLLDLLGDLRLAGGGLVARVAAVRSGHVQNLCLVERLVHQAHPIA